jgi:hypothetical protein
MTEERFLDNGDGTVTDREKSLMWTKTDTMIDLKKWVNYQEAIDYARNLNEKQFAGYNDWRLPTKEEMESIYDASLELEDKFGKTIHISDRFEKGCGISMLAKVVDGRRRTFVISLRDGSIDHPDGLWTLAESARAVRAL